MSVLFRSEAMRYVQINVSNSSAHDTVRELGNFGKFHIVDLSSMDGDKVSKEHLAYKKKVLECAALERRLQRLEELMVEYRVNVPDVFPVEYREGDVLAALHTFLEPTERALNQCVEAATRLRQDISSRKEHLHVLNILKDNMNMRELGANPGGIDAQRLVATGPLPGRGRTASGESIELLRPGAGDPEQGGAAQFEFYSYTCGVVNIAQQPTFERMLFRVSRGNAIVRFFDIDEPLRDSKTGELVHKSVFCVVTIGQELKRRIAKMAVFCNASIYQVPPARDQYDEEIRTLQGQVSDMREVLSRTVGTVVELLSRVAHNDGASPLRDWQVALKKEKSICDALKKCHFYLTYITIEGWCPAEDIQTLESVLHEAVAFSGAPAAALWVDPENPLAAPKSPPTYFKTDKFSSAFQNLVNTYGVPRYGEVNPGLFTIVTFPFLFGVMYGDVGHGTIMTLFALLLISREKEYENKRRLGKLGDMLGMIFGGRYLILLMGLFAVYCGLIYNDCMSVPLALFKSHWRFPAVPKGQERAGTTDGGVYSFGVDPEWYHTKNELSFFNSLKMKISVTLGVTHMTFGILLGVFNHVHFGDYVSIVLEFIPQLVFMTCTFGYMIFLIVLKFTIDWKRAAGREAPNLIQTMINMFLQPGKVDPAQQLYAGQPTMQLLLLSVAGICVPIMLLGKPTYEYLKRKSQGERMHHGNSYSPVQQLDDDEESLDEDDADLHVEDPIGAHGGDGDDDEKKVADPATAAMAEAARRRQQQRRRQKRRKQQGGGGDDEHDEHPLSEVYIHQAIHTIEFVLGAVSNTASYLRLWALSLAHAELANVFWEKLIVETGMDSGQAGSMVIAFAAWAGATSMVLLAMDSLECFLHALRLHWVEFQSKFYNADGYEFTPFNFTEAMAIHPMGGSTSSDDELE
eukprot:TRINITY_DN67445_c6_g4_i1.p1 TRINITY_DN67445_c6_g4~~TRINITY_DN67445_c6_g4_i1.p1  ORF type:complete len:915 (+),score=490.58 TRINITY_DN67445_c6_g4_i1:117-2861(+)